LVGGRPDQHPTKGSRGLTRKEIGTSVPFVHVAISFDVGMQIGEAARGGMQLQAASSAMRDVPVYAGGFCGDVFSTQRRMRARLLDRAVIRYSPARDLAAHMLLSLDDLAGCWFIATNWLRAELGCQRVDTGFGTQIARDYFPGFAEAKNADYDVPSFGGSAVDNRDIAMQAMWLEPRPLIFADIKQDSRINMRLRQRLSGARTKSKFAGALRAENGSYGLICADWTEHYVPHDSILYDCFEQTVTDVLSPIIAVAKEIADRDKAHSHGFRDGGKYAMVALGHSNSAALVELTNTEIEIARLVSKGLSYKEIARIRGRSFSTIDHQLRSIRQKTGASSTSSLVSLLAKIHI
jgi:DNA-binding CsgD family transcriptional regulator